MKKYAAVLAVILALLSSFVSVEAEEVLTEDALAAVLRLTNHRSRCKALKAGREPSVLVVSLGGPADALDPSVDKLSVSSGTRTAFAWAYKRNRPMRLVDGHGDWPGLLVGDGGAKSVVVDTTTTFSLLHDDGCGGEPQRIGSP